MALHLPNPTTRFFLARHSHHVLPVACLYLPVIVVFQSVTNRNNVCNDRFCVGWVCTLLYFTLVKSQSWFVYPVGIQFLEVLSHIVTSVRLTVSTSLWGLSEVPSCYDVKERPVQISEPTRSRFPLLGLRNLSNLMKIASCY